MSRNVKNFDPIVWHPDGNYAFTQRGGRFTSQEVTVHLEDLEDRLLEWLAAQTAVVGCVAWLTNERLLRVMGRLKICQVVMQKEDWMRPDYDGKHPAKTRPDLYMGGAGFYRIGLDVLSGLSYCSDPRVERFRCFGIAGDPARRPVMHHKFLVGCATVGDESRNSGLSLDPQTVWVGSFNMTKGSCRNMDSALVLGKEPAAAYFQEWVDIVTHSEPLNFEHEWCEPQWRQGS